MVVWRTFFSQHNALKCSAGKFCALPGYSLLLAVATDVVVRLNQSTHSTLFEALSVKREKSIETGLSIDIGVLRSISGAAAPMGNSVSPHTSDDTPCYVERVFVMGIQRCCCSADCRDAFSAYMMSEESSMHTYPSVTHLLWAMPK